MNATELDQLRLVASRDYTSSDEEVESSAGVTGSTFTRVRHLVWESEKTTELKRRLDEEFIQRVSIVLLFIAKE